MSSVIKVKNLEKSFKQGLFPSQYIQILKSINFTVKAGEVTGFLGANGSGKTTTMKCILELIWPDRGECLFFNGQKLNSQIWSRIGFLPEQPYFYDFLTGEEFLLFYSQLSNNKKTSADVKSRVNLLMKKMDLIQDKNKKLREYSKGMLQKVGLLQAIIHEPDLLILDEPMSGLDFNGRSYVMEIIDQVSKEGTSVFLSSHLLYDVQRLCKNLVVLKSGEVIFDGSMDEFIGSSTKKIEITYLDADKNRQFKSVSDEFQCQETIDQLREKKLQIVSIHTMGENLEETFKELALKK